MKLKRSEVREQLAGLRALIENTDDRVLMRIAYSMEYAVRLVIEDTEDWDDLVTEAKNEADILRNELAREKVNQ